MKKLLYSLLTFCAFALSAQSILIADNNPNAPTGTNIFATLQEAIDAASPGDTIYIQPSNTTYGTGEARIELHFRGIGFNLDKDVPYTSNVALLELWGSSDGSTNASNSSVSGLGITTLYLGRGSGDLNYTLTGVRIFNNSINSLTYFISAPIDDLVVAYNFINNISFNEGMTNTFIRNNVIDGNIQFFNSVAINANVTNNIINGAIRKDAIDDFLVIQNNNFIGSQK